MTKLLPALALLLMAGPVLAQGVERSPPTPNAASAAPEPANAIPQGGSNLNTSGVNNPNPSGPVGVTGTSPGLPGGTVATNPAATPGNAFDRTVPTPAIK
jgi:hypothetical protein